MVNLKQYKGFALLHNDSSLEAGRLILYCYQKDIPLKKFCVTDKCPKDYVPCSTVEWCEQSLDYTIVPNYYPTWMKDYFYRKIWKEDNWIQGKKLFVKLADRHKRFNGFITEGTYSKKKNRLAQRLTVIAVRVPALSY